MRALLAGIAIGLVALTPSRAADPNWHITATVAESCRCTVSCPRNFGGQPNRNSCEGNRLIAIKVEPRPIIREQNAIVAAVHSKDGVYAARGTVRDYLGWLVVEDTLKKEGHELDLVRQQTSAPIPPPLRSASATRSSTRTASSSIAES